MTPIDALLPEAAASCPRVVVLAAHPGDEILGASSVLASGASCVVVHLTDGAPFEPELWPEDHAFASREAYARERRRESEAALALCGVPRGHVLCLDCPDQRAAWSLLPSCQRFAAIVERYDPDCLLTHAYEGTHPDHDAAAFVARGALHMIEGESHAALVEMAASHGGRGALPANDFLAPAGGGRQALTHALSDAEQAHKRAMLACHASQRRLLAQLGLTDERFRPAQHYDFTRAPHPGVLAYERLGMPTTGRTFCRQATQAMRALGIGRPQRRVALGVRVSWR